MLGKAYSPPNVGGVAAPLIRSSCSEMAQTGWSLLRNVSRLDHPVRAFQWMLRGIFLMARPPLLSKEGNTFSSFLRASRFPLHIPSAVPFPLLTFAFRSRNPLTPP